MKNALILLVLLLASRPVFPQGSVFTISSGSEIAISAGAQLCADTIYVYGTLNCTSVACVCGHTSIFCYGTCIPPELSGNKVLISGPATVDFGNVKVGSSQDAVAEISSTGTLPLNIASTVSSPGVFTIEINGGARRL